MRKFVLSQKSPQKSPQKDTQKTLKKTIYELTLQQNNKNYLNQQLKQLVSTTFRVPTPSAARENKA